MTLPRARHRAGLSLRDWKELLSADPDLQQDMEAHRARYHDSLAEQMLEDAQLHVDKDAIPALKHRASVVQWLLERWARDRYGNRLEIDARVTIDVTAAVDAGRRRLTALDANAVKHEDEESIADRLAS